MSAAPESHAAEVPSVAEARRSRRLELSALGLALVLAHLAHRSLLGLEHFGWDTYPMILTSRVASWGDLASAFTSELMQGRYPLGHFYRPVATLSFALDHALWGTAPFGYHLTNHLILLATVAGVFALAKRVIGSGWGPMTAAIVVALHPIHFAILPIAARRADMLSALFTVLTLVVLPRLAEDGHDTARARRARGLAALALGCAAAASKETGIVVLPVAVLLAFLEERGTLRARAFGALRRTSGVIVAVVAFVAARTLVLGGLGGHEDSSILGAFVDGPRLALQYVNLMTEPRPPQLGAFGLTVLLVGLVATLWTCRRANGRVSSNAIVFVLGWYAVLTWVTGLGGEVRTWYGSPYLPLYACLAGLVVELARSTLAAGRMAVGGLAACVGLFLVTAPLQDSGLVRAYEEWPMLSEWEREFLDDARAKLAVAEGGTVVDVGDFPRALRSDLARVRAVGMSRYSVQAWVDLTFPDRHIRVDEGGDPRPPAELVVLRARKGPPSRSR